MVHIGRVSYGMYVFHFGVILILTNCFTEIKASIYKVAFLLFPYTAVVYFNLWNKFQVFWIAFIKLKKN